MELFSELYSCYYRVVNKILRAAYRNPFSKGELSEIIEKNGFTESAFYILPKLLSGEWNLLKKAGDKYEAKLDGVNRLPVTALEKSWLKALLGDKRLILFLREEEIQFLKDKLKAVKPLFDVKDFYCYDKYSDGDDYENTEYILNFHQVMEAIKNKTPITISFESSKGQRITGSYLPLRLEYSNKDDKFRVYAVRIRYGKIVANPTINISRISKITASNEKFNGDIVLNNIFEYDKCSEPVVIEISKERNAVERCMLHFASFEKRTEYDETTESYISYIYYNKQDETELLIRILSFGPVIKVLGPVSFLEQIKERIKRQTENMVSVSPWKQGV